MKLQQLRLFNMHDKQNRECDICVESKIMKKTCYSIECQTEVLGLIHIILFI